MSEPAEITRKPADPGSADAEGVTGLSAGRAVDRGARPLAVFGLLVLSFVWSWWAWQEGAYFGTVALPGTILLCVATIMLCLLGPSALDLRRSKPALIGLAALAGLGLWSALSAIWSSVPDVAIADAQRIMVYALAYGLGLWVCALLVPRISLSLVPLTVAAGVASIAAVAALLTGDVPVRVLEIDGTLDFPLGYRNANAGFFGIALFAALGLASERDLDLRARAVATGVASACVALFLLCQSRGSIPAIAVAIIVYLLLSPTRLRALVWLALAVLPGLAILPALSGLYDAASADGLRSVVDEMRTAGASVGLLAVASIALGGVAAYADRRRSAPTGAPTRSNRIVAATIVALGLGSVAAFVAATGDPVDWVGDRVEEFEAGGSPDLSAEGSRFIFNAGSDRRDLWTVALDDFTADPLLGTGGGGYQDTYVKNRESEEQTAKDAHSFQLEVMGELGLPGLGLLVAALVAILVAALASRRLELRERALVGIALASGAYWFVHASVDWFWSYPALTAPVFGLLGAAAAPWAARRSGAGGRSRPLRLALIIACAVLALSTVGPFLSERYVNQATAGWRTDLEQAYEDLDRAQSLNRLSDIPILIEATIARAAGDEDRAYEALKRAEERRPEEWATHYLLARLEVSRGSTGEARRQVSLALEQNPLNSRVRALARRLGVAG